MTKGVHCEVESEGRGYVTGISNRNEKISEYQALYNYEERCFINPILDFFNDKVV
ncbi:MAG: hypothetical protein K2G55_13350 [Lachnospiraceae bacterium]|nr:hypothetical protein [Lachnospiraceae bacterium]MDE7203508.1 hypothetical protein [Lachnospiraceae bacterium]